MPRSVKKKESNRPRLLYIVIQSTEPQSQAVDQLHVPGRMIRPRPKRPASPLHKASPWRDRLNRSSPFHKPTSLLSTSSTRRRKKTERDSVDCLQSPPPISTIISVVHSSNLILKTPVAGLRSRNEWRMHPIVGRTRENRSCETETQKTSLYKIEKVVLNQGGRGVVEVLLSIHHQRVGEKNKKPSRFWKEKKGGWKDFLSFYPLGKQHVLGYYYPGNGGC